MKQKKIKIILLSILIPLFSFLLIEKNFLSSFSFKSSPDKSLRALNSVVELIKNHYVEEPNPEKTMEGAFKGLFDSLDVLSAYLDEDSITKFSQRKDPDLRDCGLILYKRYGSFPVVIGLRENSPAEKKGIKIGEYVSEIDNRSTLMMSMLEANMFLKDKEKNSINLEILGTNKNKKLIIERKKLFKENFSYSPLEQTSGKLKIFRLYPPCISKIEEDILPQLKSKKKPLILDLRNCYEGEIKEAQRLINLFLTEKKIGLFKKKQESTEILSCPKNAELEKLPLIIWTNRATMGPGELVAATLKKLRKARVIGLHTLGLVAKQDFIPLDNRSGVLLTSSVFYFGSGEKLWQEGIKPDIKISSNNQSSANYLKKTHDILVKK